MILQRWGWVREKADLKQFPGFQIYTNREDFCCVNKKRGGARILGKKWGLERKMVSVFLSSLNFCKLCKWRWPADRQLRKEAENQDRSPQDAG